LEKIEFLALFLSQVLAAAMGEKKDDEKDQKCFILAATQNSEKHACKTITLP
jgi:hypothetical protein